MRSCRAWRPRVAAWRGRGRIAIAAVLLAQDQLAAARHAQPIGFVPWRMMISRVPCISSFELTSRCDADAVGWIIGNVGSRIEDR